MDNKTTTNTYLITQIVVILVASIAVCLGLLKTFRKIVNNEFIIGLIIIGFIFILFIPVLFCNKKWYQNTLSIVIGGIILCCIFFIFYKC